MNERVYLAQQRLSVVRLAIVMLNAGIFALQDKAGTLPIAAYALIGVALCYTLYVWATKPFRRYSLRATAYLTTVVDGVFVLVWIAATGGATSPFHVLLSVSMVAAAFLIPPRHMAGAALLTSAGYLFVVLALDPGKLPIADVVARTTYILITAGLAAIIAREVGQLTARTDSLEERLREKEALQRSQRQLAEAQSVAHLGSWEWTLRDGKLTWSTEMHHILDVGVEAKPDYETYLRRIHPDDSERVTGILGASLENGEPFSVEHRLVRKDGDVRYVLSRGHVVLDAEKQVERMFGTVQDVTERKDLEHRLWTADRMASLGTLAGGVAHEINNPLTYVLGNLEFVQSRLQAGAPPSDDWVEALSEAREGAERVRGIVRDLKTFSRDDGQQAGPVDVVTIVEKCINMTFNEVRHHARLVRELAQVPLCRGHVSRLSQVFINLLVNAAHAIPVGRADQNQITVRTYPSQDGSRVIIEVQDTGEGIPADARSRIFEPFFTTKPVGRGTGLGLAVCHGIIKALGGEITFDSVVGRGTTFRVSLLTASADAFVGSATEQEPASTGTRRGSILVVDDDVMVGRAVRRALESDHDITVVNSGQDALALVENGHRFDVILCDLMMPDTTGMDVHATLSKIAPEQVARMVLMTGGAFTPNAQAFLAHVPNPKLHKPLDTGALKATIREHLR